MIVLYLCICLFQIVFGAINAFIYGRKGADSLKRDEHIDIVVLQGLFFLYPFLVLWLRVDVYELCWATVAGIFATPFFKDGAYFETRKRMDPTVYRLGWLDDSTTSTAIINFKMPMRVLFFIGSILMLVYAYL
jgi:hypothetical protein